MLKITGDGRKAALDLQLVGLPQPPGGKLDVAAERIAAIHKATKKDKGTQLVFSDLGTPKVEKGKGKGKPAEDAGPTFDADDSGFNVYAALRDKLVDAGVPRKEIAFIHDANTDARKLALFNDVRTGRVRVLIGSTEKMGAGMNVQDRLVAQHHLDAPWRPSDVEQRDGRILRQGNLLAAADPNFEVEIIRYLAEGSFDAYMWQILESKAKFINQAMSGDINGRSVEDVDVVMINSAAQAKAIASGNPMVFEKVKADAEVAKLESLQASWEDARWRLRNDIAIIPKQLEARQRDLADLEGMQAAVRLPDPWSLTSRASKTYGERKDGGDRLIGAARKTYMDSRATGREVIGRFAGLDIAIQTEEDPKKNTNGIGVMLTHGDASIHVGFIQADADPVGWTARLMNGVAQIDSQIEWKQKDIAHLTRNLKDAKARADVPWEKADQLKAALQEQARLDKALDLDAKSQAQQAPAAADDDGDGGGVNSMPIINAPARTPATAASSGTAGCTPTDRMRPSAIIERLRKGLGDIPVSVGRFRQHASASTSKSRRRSGPVSRTMSRRSRTSWGTTSITRSSASAAERQAVARRAAGARAADVTTVLHDGPAAAGRRRRIPAALPDRAARAARRRRRNTSPSSSASLRTPGAQEGAPRRRGRPRRADRARPGDARRLRIDFTGDNSDGIYRRLKDDPKGAVRRPRDALDR
jgi:hypothetical protein